METENQNQQAFSTFFGLTKREYIATQLLAGLLVNETDIGISSNVSRAVLAADELLKQLNNE